MSEFDVTAASYLNSAVLPILLLVIGLILFWKNRKTLRQRYFAAFYVRFSKTYSSDMSKFKEELFKDLKDFKSLDWDLRNKGLIRVLEIGVGPGTNFKYYPQNSRVIAVDPNPFFRDHLEQKSGEFPHIKLEKIVVGEGENLVGVADNSVDVVITTLVLCTVRDVKAVLSEIKRVLALIRKLLL